MLNNYDERWTGNTSSLTRLVALYSANPGSACCMQLADQNIEDFMSKRGFHAMPGMKTYGQSQCRRSLQHTVCMHKCKLQLTEPKRMRKQSLQRRDCMRNLPHRAASSLANQSNRCACMPSTQCMTHAYITMHHACLFVNMPLASVVACSNDVLSPITDAF